MSGPISDRADTGATARPWPGLPGKGLHRAVRRSADLRDHRRRGERFAWSARADGPVRHAQDSARSEAWHRSRHPHRAARGLRRTAQSMLRKGAFPVGRHVGMGEWGEGLDDPRRRRSSRPAGTTDRVPAAEGEERPGHRWALIFRWSAPNMPRGQRRRSLSFAWWPTPRSPSYSHSWTSPTMGTTTEAVARRPRPGSTRVPPNPRLVLTVRRASQARHGAPQHTRRALGGRSTGTSTVAAPIEAGAS